MMFFRSHLKSHWPVYVLWLAFAGVLLGSFLLYHLPLQAVLYPLGLCFAGGVVYQGCSILRDYRRHKVLSALLNATAQRVEGLPIPADALEADYQALLRREEDLRQQDAIAAAGKYDDMVAYYTVWAHQIKTPIASMRLSLQNEDTPFARRQLQDLARIEQYADMVLAFLRLESESTDYLIHPCDLDTILRPAIKSFAGEIIGKHLTLRYEPIHRTVLTDEKWLGFVLRQILSNAIKYTNEGSISVTWEEPGALCIRDTGIGIRPEDLPRIFENGFTGYNGREHTRATGIGLYLCARICRNLHHPISAESVPGEGTAIRLDLRRARLEIE